MRVSNIGVIALHRSTSLSVETNGAKRSHLIEKKLNKRYGSERKPSKIFVSEMDKSTILSERLTRKRSRQWQRILRRGNAQPRLWNLETESSTSTRSPDSDRGNITLSSSQFRMSLRRYERPHRQDGLPLLTRSIKLQSNCNRSSPRRRSPKSLPLKRLPAISSMNAPA